MQWRATVAAAARRLGLRALRARTPGAYFVVDPGVRHIVTGRFYVVGADGSVTVDDAVYTLSKGEYNNAVASERRARRAAAWRAATPGLAAADAALAAAHARTASLSTLAAHVAAFAAHAPTLRAYAAQRRHAADRLDADIRAQSCLDGFWAGVARDGAALAAAAGVADTTPTVLYGDGSFAARGSPTVAVYDAAVRAFGAARVVLVDEFRTTARCADCTGCLQEVAAPVDDAAGRLAARDTTRVTAGIKRCVNPACAAAMFKDRDVNAVANIFAVWAWVAALGPGAGRPPAVARGGAEAGAAPAVWLPRHVRRQQRPAAAAGDTAEPRRPAPRAQPQRGQRISSSRPLRTTAVSSGGGGGGGRGGGGGCATAGRPAGGRELRAGGAPGRRGAHLSD